MKLDYAYKDISNLLSHTESHDTSKIESIVFDTRRLTGSKGVLFFALKGIFRDGHDFISDAYSKGVRHFVVSEKGCTQFLEGAHEIVVDNTLNALQSLAHYHRSRFNCKVVAITGSNGKTTVKEWLSELLSSTFFVARSPKSYNSHIGSAISLFEISAKTDIAIIEVGVPEKGGMSRLEKMIQPTHGILTSLGTAHGTFFDSEEEHYQEKFNLFKNLDAVICPKILHKYPTNAFFVSSSDFSEFLEGFPIKDSLNIQNAALAVAMAKELGVDAEIIKGQVMRLNSLALRLETYDGHRGNTIINDTYNLDDDSLRLSLEYQLANAQGKKRIVLIGLPEKNSEREAQIAQIINDFEPDEFHFHYKDISTVHSFSEACILIKGTRDSGIQLIANQFRLQQHQTFLEIDLTAIRHNINYHKTILNENTQLLCMVKASSYGSDARKMGNFLASMGVDYLGVAYPDEGVQLRQSGVELPILVMNCEKRSFSHCIEHSLEPAIYSMEQLIAFIKELISHSIHNYPVHIKLETGMNRLGFTKEELKTLIEIIKAQPEILIKSVYSHLAESDVQNSPFTEHQIDSFNIMSDQIENEFSYPILKHILNSTGIENYPEAQYDMVRLGIGMYGVTSNEHLIPAISWLSSVSQVKNVDAGQSVGYGRTFMAKDKMNIAVIPVGYADGFRRSLSQGKGGVYIQNTFCPTVGNVCMDMIMVDVTGLKVIEGDRVEIIGNNQTIDQFAAKMDTIPYEVMTGLSMRVHRLFVDQ